MTAPSPLVTGAEAPGLPLHMVWLGGSLPLRHLLNLCRLVRQHEARLGARVDVDGASPPYLPLLWLDRSAWTQTLAQASLPVAECAAHEVPPLWQQAWARLAHRAADPTPRWLRLSQAQAPLHVPVLIFEEQRAALARPWAHTDAAAERLAGLSHTPEGERLCVDELGLADLPLALRHFDGLQAWRCLDLLIDHSRAHWARHGLLCLASDLLRLLVLVWRPGAYADLGDVAGQLKALPGPADVPAAHRDFCAHHTVAIENDLIFAHSAVQIQAIAWGAALWGARTIERTAQRLGLDCTGLKAPERLRAVLPELDRHLPPVPELRGVFEPPGTRLADYIAMAYGSQPHWGHADALRGYFAGRRGKEMLVDHVAGFTGYQKFAHHLAPGNRLAWAQCAQQLGLSDYAPQLGWKSYGFGTVDRLIDLARLLEADEPEPAQAARHELARVLAPLGWDGAAGQALARHASALHQLLAHAHFEPAARAPLMAEIASRCAAWDRSAGRR